MAASMPVARNVEEDIAGGAGSALNNHTNASEANEWQCILRPAGMASTVVFAARARLGVG